MKHNTDFSVVIPREKCVRVTLYEPILSDYLRCVDSKVTDVCNGVEL
jgi:hypothetical protein